LRDFSLILAAYGCVAVVFLALLQSLTEVLGRLGVTEALLPSAAFIASAVVAYPALYLYLFSPGAGSVYSVLVLLFGLRGLRPAALQQAPFVLGAACGLAYLGALMLFATNIPLRSLPQQLFFEMTRPDDHQLQLLFLERIVAHSPSRFGTFGTGWHFTDRPPLETSYALLFSPLGRVFGLDVLYQATGTALQTTSLAAAWCLARALRFARSEIRLAVLVLAGSGFIYYNSVYLWPKMLAASLFLAALVPFATALWERRRLSLEEVLVAATGCAMAVLSHGAVAYSLLALAVLAAIFAPRLFTLKRAIAGFAVAAVLFAPWQAYSIFVDPNTGKLLKMHLTKANPDSPEPFRDLLLKSYTTTPWSEWLHNRVANLSILGGAYYVDPVIAQLKNGILDARKEPPLKSFGYENVIEPQRLSYDLKSLATVLRIDQREHFLRALGPMALGLPVLALAAIPGWRKRIFDRGLLAVIVLEAATLVVWNIVEFNAFYDVLTDASYASVILAFLVNAALLYRVSPRLGWGVGIASIALNLILWVGFVPGQMVTDSRFDWLAALALAGGATSVVALSRSEPETP
jgi:hypothetical protein